LSLFASVDQAAITVTSSDPCTLLISNRAALKSSSLSVETSHHLKDYNYKSSQTPNPRTRYIPSLQIHTEDSSNIDTFSR
jgi:hypothetical protein